MEKKYTTGSWSFKIVNDKAYFSGEGWHDFGYVYVAMYGGEYNSPEGLANARLIAAAPDLLEALYEAEEYFDNRADADHDETGFVPNEEMKLLVSIRAAIRKAYGRKCDGYR